MSTAGTVSHVIDQLHKTRPIFSCDPVTSYKKAIPLSECEGQDRMLGVEIIIILVLLIRLLEG